MHPLHSDLVAELVREEHLRAAAAHSAAVQAVGEEREREHDLAPSFARRALDRLRLAANTELRHHA